MGKCESKKLVNEISNTATYYENIATWIHNFRERSQKLPSITSSLDIANTSIAPLLFFFFFVFF